jgi:predicted ATP-grasp superfamily ATP-dependent carboligase
MINEKSGAPFPAAFVTYGWCRTAYTVVRSLGSKGIEVHVGDPSPLAMSRYSRYAKSFTSLPEFFEEPERYLAALGNALDITGASVLMPCHEDVELVIKGRAHLPPDVKIAVPELSMWTTAEDKALYVNHIQSAGCPVPRTFDVHTTADLEAALSDLSPPYVIKTRIGNSAKGVRIAETRERAREEFFRLVETFDLSPERWPTVQEFVDGQKVGVLGVYANGKHVSSIVFDIVRSKGANNFGTSTYRVVIDDPVTKANAIRAMESLNWHGVVDMDWLRDRDGTARLIDINGRLGGATALTYISGMDMPYLWYLVALGENEIPENEIQIGAKARWILGDTLGMIDSLRKGKWGECMDVLTPVSGCRHDDFDIRDPGPFFFQAADYLRKFIAAGGSLNPVRGNMVR